MSALKLVISGSYRKHLSELYALKSFLTAKGFEVLSPSGEKALNPGEEFVILNSDPLEDPRILQDSIFAKMRQASFQVVLNKDGYLGKASILEIGYAISLGLQVLTIERVEDPNIAAYTRCFDEVFPDWKQEDCTRQRTS